MVKMFGNNKNVFWEALLLTLVVFILGLLLGVAYESAQLEKINDYYAKSENSLMDMVALNSLVDVENTTCEQIAESSIKFANRIYEEAIILDELEEAGKITDDMKMAHKKYDLLRTFLWINLLKAEEKCHPEENISLVVYLYEYETDDLAKKATQKVWSKVLYDLKQKKGDEIILISIAADTNITSLDTILQRFYIRKLPVVIINNKIVIEKLSSVEELEKYLNS